MNDNITIGRVILLDAYFVKKRVLLVNKSSGELETVTDDKYFSAEEYSRYYMITEEVPAEEDIVWAYESTPHKDYQITYLNNVKNREKKTVHKCYPVSNSVIPRIHKGYYSTVISGGKEFFRFTKVNNRYAGFPTSDALRVSTTEARKRWDFIFNHVLAIESNTETKRKVGSLFGGVQNIDLREEKTMALLNKYKPWLCHKL